MDTESDSMLLSQWRDGDARAGNELFSRHFDAVYQFFANKRLGEVDDLVQRTFCACARARDDFAGRSSFRTYLFKIAHRELYRHIRCMQRDRARSCGTETDLNRGTTHALADHCTTPGTRVARARDRELVRDALASLPLDQRELLELRYWQDMGGPELAEIFEAPPETIRTRLFRARAALRRRIGARMARLRRIAPTTRPQGSRSSRPESDI